MIAKKEIKVGDKVRWSAKFLRSIADYSMRSASAYGTVESIDDFGKFTLARLKDCHGLPGLVRTDAIILMDELEHD